jgi:hypothetical protein
MLALQAGTRAEEYKAKTGAFEVSLLSLARQRDVMLAPAPWVWVDEDGHQRPMDKRAPKLHSSAGPVFQARVRITTDPPTSFRLNGAPTIVEAVDDLDQTLEPTPEETTATRPRGMAPRGAYPMVEMRMPLSLPEQPGKLIKRLKGSVPVVVFARSAEPLAVLSVSDPKGRTVTAGDFTVIMGSVRSEPDQPTVILALTVRLEKEKGNFRDREYQARIASKLVDFAQQQIEVVDDQTRRVAAYPTTSVRKNEVRVTLRLSPGEQYGAPDRIRLFGLTTTETELPFDFKNVPMP